jgi:hypothetical protein
MGWLDRLKKSSTDAHGDDEVDEGADPVVDREARRPQLDELDEALRALARQLAADTDRMRNPGWSGRVADLRALAREAVDLGATEFSRAELLDVVASVGPLPRGAEYEPFAAAQARVDEVADALREVLPSEQ